MDFKRVWHWASANHGFVEGLGGGSLGRALNAFTHLFDGGGSYLDILWAVMALEALYVDSEEKYKARQLRKRTQILLGSARSRHRSRLTKAYDMRSRLVHGDADIPAFHFEHDATPEFDQFLGRYIDAEDYVMAILVATLQTMAERDLKELSFAS